MHNDLATEWQSVMRDWDAAKAAYEQAFVAAKQADPAAEPSGAPLDRARARLLEIKKRIDSIVRAGSTSRAGQPPDAGQLVVGTLERRPTGISPTFAVETHKRSVGGTKAR